MALSSFLSELRRRRVIRVAGIWHGASTHWAAPRAYQSCGVSFEKLRVYQAAVLLDELVIEPVAHIPRGHSRDIDQLRRASASIGHNIAEAHGCDDGRKVLHLQIARGSADETRSILYRLAGRRALTRQAIFRPCGLTVAIAKMLTSWIAEIGG